MLYFVGVGPGDPELITLKAARILSQADAIALLDSGKESVVWKIAGKWMENKPLCRLYMPMKGTREMWEDAHRQAAETMLAWLDQYENIAYPVLGDPGIYASSAYLMRSIASRHPCRVVAGVPAMCAAAAELGVPLCEQGERLTVVDCPVGHNIAADDNIVIMKAGRDAAAIAEIANGRQVFAACNVGMENQRVGKPDEVDLSATYFTTVILKPNTDT